ncbi:hypothetical protein V6N13_004128 [Hibiscus sabdariffa]|uniref:Clp R domain-containing protein n=1 Tax=Hibiscus sabdariffa TaxID=183260 RepID=A0ABR2RXI8_9ROSI
MGIKLKDAREQVGKICPRGRGCFAVGFPFTSLATSALLHSLEHARKRGHNLIGPEHLLLGLLRQHVARCVLKDLGADSSNIYAQVVSILDQGNNISIVSERSTGNTTPEPVGYGTNLTKLLDKIRSSFGNAILSEHYEIRHKLRYTDEALIAAAERCRTSTLEAVIRIDEDEIEGDNVVSRFIGSHPENTKEGGHLTEPVRRRPYTVVIFDEICVVHDVFNMILEILEYGRMKHRAVEKLELFKPIAKRFDEVIVFMQLTKSEAKEITDVKLKEAFDRLKAKEIQLDVTERFRETVAEQG